MPEAAVVDPHMRERRPEIRRVVVACVILAAGTWLFIAKASQRMPDFEVYWRAGTRAAHAEPLYRSEDGEYQFKYFPGFAVAAMTIAALPLPLARAVWFTALLCALVTLLWCSVTLLPEQRKARGLLLAVLLVGLGKYYVRELVLGQINLLLILTIVLAMLAMKAGREARAGWLVALAVVIKPYALILVPWLVARGRAPSIASATAGLAVSFLLPATIYGFRGGAALYEDWWRTVSATTAGTLTHPDNVSLASMYTKWFGTTAAASACAIVTSAALLALAAATFVRRQGVRHPDGLEAGMLIALTPLLSPQGWDYVLVVCTPAVVYLANYHDTLARVPRLLSAVAVAAIGLTLYDLVGRTIYYALIRASVVTLGVLVVVAALAALRVQKTA